MLSLPVFVIKKKQRTKLVKKKISGRSYKNYDSDVFLRLLGDQDWNNYFVINDPDRLWDIMIRNITHSLDSLCPIKLLTVVDTKPGWLSNALLLQMRNRDRAYKRARRTRLQADWETAKQIRNTLSTNIKIAKSNFIKSELENNKNNPRKLWEKINELLPNTKNEDVHELKDELTNETFSREQLNDHINEYFANIGPMLAARCTPGLANMHIPFENPEWNFNRTPFTEEEVYKVCKSIDVNKSSSLTNIKSMVLKDAFLSNLHIVTRLFNCSLRTSKFPNGWKLSSIVPLPKVKNPSFASDLRPVALTPLPGKLMEKLICSRLKIWLNSYNILSNCQHGFRKERSTITATCAFLNTVYNYINQNKNPTVIYLDLKKAFDTVSHLKLINKLRKLGLDDQTVGWFESYLDNRTQCVIMNNNRLNILPITYGVPQGSILGPILFSIYINEIADLLSCNVVLYADDTVILHDNVEILQYNLNKIVTWCNDNHLTLNAKKSQWMRFNVCNEQINPNNININILGKNLEMVKVYKYLGVFIDTQLNFQHHNKILTRNVNFKVTHFKRIRRFITRKAAELIYKCTILPVLEYADFIVDHIHK